MFNTFFKRLLILTLAASAIYAAGAVNPDIVTVITRDSIIKVNQPSGLALRLERGVESEKSIDTSAQASSEQNNPVSEDQATHPREKTVGYRVQVFSDNNIRTAKGEARSKAAAIGSSLPQYKTYVTYEAPFWRLRVGDFRSKSDAMEAADEIKRAFPHYSREIRVIRDRVNL